LSINDIWVFLLSIETHVEKVGALGLVLVGAVPTRGDALLCEDDRWAEGGRAWVIDRVPVHEVAEEGHLNNLEDISVVRLRENKGSIIRLQSSPLLPQLLSSA